MRKLMVLSALMMSIVSFVTTFGGMVEFLQPQIMVAFVTFALQALLLVSSWELGRLIKSDDIGRLHAVLMGGVFLFCFAISAFFSLTALFDRVYRAELQDLDRSVRVANAVAETVSSLRADARASQLETGEGVRSGEDFLAWRASLAKIETAADGADAALADLFRSRNAAFAEAEANAAAEKATREQAAKAAQTRREDAEGDLKRIEGELPQTVAAVGKARTARAIAQRELETARREMELELTGRDGRLGGRGPRYQSALAVANAKEAEVVRATAEITRLETRRSEIEEELRRLRSILPDLRTEEARAKALAALDAAAEKDKAPTSRNPALVAGLSMEEQVRAMRSLIDRFGPPYDAAATGAVREAAAICSELRPKLAASRDLLAAMDGAECGRDLLNRLLAPVDQAQALTAVLDERCGPETASADVIAGLGFEQSLALARNCIAAAELPPAASASLRGRLTRLEREESPDASYFVKTTNAVLAGEKLAVFALIIAVGIDLIVLLCGLIGARGDTVPLPVGVRHIRRARAKLQILDETLAVAARHFSPGYRSSAIAAVLLSILERADRDGSTGDGSDVVDIARLPAELRSAGHQALGALKNLKVCRHLDRDRYSLDYDGVALLQALAGDGPASPVAMGYLAAPAAESVVEGAVDEGGWADPEQGQGR